MHFLIFSIPDLKDHHSDSDGSLPLPNGFPQGALEGMEHERQRQLRQGGDVREASLLYFLITLLLKSLPSLHSYIETTFSSNAPGANINFKPH